MNAAVQRVFEAKPAVREAVGLMIGIVGPSSSGKTYSALRLATGIQRVVGGSVDVIDTENGRALYYADKFRFNHVRFGAPFSPLDYLEAIRYCAKRGTKTIVIDSMSHEHEGPGGLLEWHEAEVQRISGGDAKKAERVKMLAWAKPKAARRRLINEILQLNVNLILTFRAKEKVKIIPGKEPQALGWQPIAGDEFVYEMVLQCLLKPGAKGLPSWESEYESERAMMKVPEQFINLFGAPKQLDEDLAIKLAEWAVGGSKPAPELDALIADYAKCTDTETFKALEQRRAGVWSKPMPAGYKTRVKEASDAASKRLSEPPAQATAANAPVADIATWVETFTSQETPEGNEQAWTACQEAFGGNPPNECHAAYTLQKEKLSDLAVEEL